MRPIDADAYADDLWKLRRNYQMLDDTHTADKIMHGIFRAEQVLKEQPTLTASPWRRVEEPPKESCKQYVVWASKGYAYCDKWLGDRWLISSVAPETVTHWMPIEPPKEGK